MSNLNGMAELQSSFEKYLDHSTRDLEDILEHQGDQLAVDLFDTTRKYSPPPEQIFSLPTELNWHIKRKEGYAVFTTETFQDKSGNLTRKYQIGKHRKSRSKKMVKFLPDRKS